MILNKLLKPNDILKDDIDDFSDGKYIAFEEDKTCVSQNEPFVFQTVKASVTKNNSVKIDFIESEFSNLTS